MKKKYLFIVNPISGGKKVNKSLLIRNNIDSSVEATIFETEYPGHARELTKQHHKDFDAVFAVGGDGTVNEVASELNSSNTPLGIVPFGSGNGLARTVNYSMNAKKVISTLHTLSPRKINTAFWNNELFLCAAGFGFDGEVAKQFSTHKSRGFFGYVKIILSNYFKFKPFTASINDKKYDNIFICSFLNAGQYGNNFKLSPHKSLISNDVELVIIKKPNIFQAFGLFFYAYFGDVEKLSFVYREKGQNFTVKTPHQSCHLDGEYKESLKDNIATISFRKEGLTVLKQ